MNLGDFLKNINETKNLDLINDNEKDYSPFIVNRCLSMHLDAILYVNEMNMRPGLPKKLQHDFLVVSLRKMKRFAKLHKKENFELIRKIQKLYNISEAKATQLAQILKEDEKEIDALLDEGGAKSSK